MSVVRGFSCTVEKMRKFVSGESWRVNIIGNFGYNLAAGDTDPCTGLTRPRRTDHHTALHTGLQLPAPPSWTLSWTWTVKNCGTRKERHIRCVCVQL